MKLCQSGSGRYCLTLLASTLFAMVLGITLPTTAWASDGEEGTTGFLAGLDTLVNPDSAREIENDPVRDYEYEPDLRAGEGETAELPEEGSEIQSVIDAANTVSWGANNGRTLFNSVRYFLFQNNSTKEWLLLIPAGLVFMWWGIRKSVHMLFAAFRSGRMTVGGMT